MRTVRLKLYKFSELDKKGQETALKSQAQFEAEFMGTHSPYLKAAKLMEKLQTPWFLVETIYHDYKPQLIADIEANDYEFTGDGKIH